MAGLIADPFRAARLILLLRQAGITDDGVLKAMETIDRGAFVDPALADLAFEDCVLPIPCGQIISSPTVTGQLLQAMQITPLQKEARILLVGAGSGYTAALAAQLGAHVYAIERYKRLTEALRQRIIELKLETIAVKHGDGLVGWPEQGPYDRILLTGAVTSVPENLILQLARGGSLIAPLLSDNGLILQRVGSDESRQTLPFSGTVPSLTHEVACEL